MHAFCAEHLVIDERPGVSPAWIKKVGVSCQSVSPGIPRNDHRPASRDRFFTLRGCCASSLPRRYVRGRCSPGRLVKVNIYEGANHRHRSSRLVNQLRRRGLCVYIRRTGILFIVSPKKTRPPLPAEWLGTYAWPRARSPYQCPNTETAPFSTAVFSENTLANDRDHLLAFLSPRGRPPRTLRSLSLFALWDRGGWDTKGLFGEDNRWLGRGVYDVFIRWRQQWMEDR